MRKGGGKSKGAAFERDVCKRLSLWISDGKDDGLLWRSAMSGGRATLSLQKGKQAASQAGDISAISQEAYNFMSMFSIECKTYRTLNFHNMVFGGKAGLPEFWEQAVHDAASHNKIPILIAKQNQYPPIICLNEDGLARLDCSANYKVAWYHRKSKDFVLIYLLDEFLKKTSPNV